MKCYLVTILICVLNHVQTRLHKTPPMGWSSWNTFNDQITEDKIIGIADAMTRLQLDKYGYKYVTIDDLWNLPTRNNLTKNMQVNTKRFPKGMKYLGDYLHAKGLKFGLYSDAGIKTCAGMAGSLGYEELDLDQFIEWGIDYLKYDNCYPSHDQPDKIHVMDKIQSVLHIPSFYQNPSEENRYSKMGEAILKAKGRRNITLELCLYGWGNVEKWAHKYGDIWRTSGDIG